MVNFGTSFRKHFITDPFSGGDQGLLNKYFFEWSRLGPSHRIPFGYNMSSSAVYTYAAAYKRLHQIWIYSANATISFECDKHSDSQKMSG